MVETLFVQLGAALVNIAKVRAIQPVPRFPDKCMLIFEGPSDSYNPLSVDCSFQDVQRALAETYQQMAMMQAAANRQGYGPAGGSIQ
jgi:hypothetical protein